MQIHGKTPFGPFSVDVPIPAPPLNVPKIGTPEGSNGQIAFDAKILRLNTNVGQEMTTKVAEWLTSLYRAPIHRLSEGMTFEKKGNTFVPRIEELTIEINSPGGNCNDGFVIYDMLRSIPKETKITTVVTGFAASAASVIFCAGDDRYVTPGSELLIHQAYFPLLWYMKEEDMKAYTESLIRCNDRIVDTYSKVSGKSKTTIKKDMQLTDKMLVGREAIEYGLANKMLFTR